MRDIDLSTLTCSGSAGDLPLRIHSDVDDDLHTSFDDAESVTPVLDGGRVSTIGNFNKLFDWK